MRIVIDTNVIISALMRPESPPGLLLKYWEQDMFTLCVSEDSLAEIRRVLKYAKVRRFLKQSDEELDDFVYRMQTRAKLFSDLVAVRLVLGDPDDDKFLSLADGASADYLVSGDRHLLSQKHYKETWIVSPAAMLTFLSVPTSQE